ncbi:patatin-like phospholipase family protein [Alkaliphilus serpentinus]|uniref:Patatin-like phospholipase family protein n=1 Tax=Alkaliphilus serpentinus TaxID=1482731 RepID=A0A833HPT5_9FIRM|nr:patatin-like phospholipase family protein [Alkaliphilus serpentinus]KAB3531153.1 patatin-like phospholipase family protein [Alkaliphilus serpentinus]
MLGLTLEGGGAKGAYHIGAWRAFRELGIEFDGITGTSVGALNGALMIQDDFDTAWDIWYNINPGDVMKVDEKTIELIGEYQITTEHLNILYDEFKRVIKGSGIDITPLELMIKRNLKEDKLRSSKKDFGFVTVCLTDRKPLEIFKEDVPYGKMAEYLMASANLPIFKGKKIEGKSFLDGGFYDNLPMEMLYRRGYKKIIAVRVMAMGRVRRLKYDDLEIINIIPNRKLGLMLEFTKERSRTNMALGYLDTMKTLKNLKGNDYYIDYDFQDDEAIEFFKSFNTKTITNLAKILKLNNQKTKEALLMEDIIPRIAKLMNIKKENAYSEILVGMVEHMAAYKNIDPLKIYTIKDLLGQVYHEATNDLQENERKDYEVIEEIFIRLNKEKLLTEALKVIFTTRNAYTVGN